MIDQIIKNYLNSNGSSYIFKEERSFCYMIVIPGRIPIAIHPFFWLLALLIGWINSGGSFLGTFIWVGIILVSVVFHEYGHALTSICFKQRAKIQLVALGGATTYDGPKLKFWQQFIIVLNGPLFGFILFLIATFLLKFNWSSSPTIFGILKITQIANLFWTVLNLLPILPLDGGQLLRIVLEAFFGLKGFKASLLTGAIVASLFAFYFFIVQFFLAGALFFLFAFQSFDLWRKSRNITSSDREDGNRKVLIEAEMALREGRNQEAKALFSQVIDKVKKGILASTASQYLALLLMQEGKKKEAYDLLLPIEEDLSDETKPILHQLAAEQKNFEVVARLSKESYQIHPTKEAALQNARAFAFLNNPKLAGGWLQTAWTYGGIDLAKILNEDVFAKVKEESSFQQFIQKLH